MLIVIQHSCMRSDYMLWVNIDCYSNIRLLSAISVSYIIQNLKSQYFIMSRKTTSNKRRRLDSTRSQASSRISTLSNISRSADNIFDSDDMNFQSSRGGAHGSRDDVTCVVIPHINSEAQPASTVNRRQRRVSWNLCNEEEETFVKEFNNQSNVPYDNRKNPRNLPHHNSYARNSSRTVDIPCHYDISSSHSPIRNDTSHEELRRKYEEQEKMIEFLLQKDRINNPKRTQRRSVSVTSLQGTPTIRVPTLDDNDENGNTRHLNESILQGSQFHRSFHTNLNIPDGYVFTTPAKNAARYNKMRSRSCDFLNDEEHKELIGSPVQVIEQSQASRGSNDLDVLEAQPDDNITEREINPNNTCSNSCRYRLFRKWFYTLLVVNAIVVLMNTAVIPFLYVATYGHNKEDFVCMECGTLLNNGEDISGFQNLEDGKCCLTSSKELLIFLMNVSMVQHVNETT